MFFAGHREAESERDRHAQVREGQQEEEEEEVGASCINDRFTSSEPSNGRQAGS